MSLGKEARRDSMRWRDMSRNWREMTAAGEGSGGEGGTENGRGGRRNHGRSERTGCTSHELAEQSRSRRRTDSRLDSISIDIQWMNEPLPPFVHMDAARTTCLQSPVSQSVSVQVQVQDQIQVQTEYRIEHRASYRTSLPPSILSFLCQIRVLTIVISVNELGLLCFLYVLYGSLIGVSSTDMRGMAESRLPWSLGGGRCTCQAGVTP